MDPLSASPATERSANAPPADGPVVYVGRDLEAMSFAENYHRWIRDRFRPYMGTRLVEVGAGSGTFSELLLEGAVDSLDLVEPSDAMYRLLEERARGFGGVSVTTHHAMFGQVAERLRDSAPDSIIYVNVLEHVADDVAELATIRDTLSPGGRIFLFVPALPHLYGAFDEQVGHYRRYTKPELVEKCARAGLRVIDARYFDLFGVLPWWVKYRLLKSDALEAGAVKLYDRWVVPAARLVEARLRPPLGKNVLVVAEKS